MVGTMEYYNSINSYLMILFSIGIGIFATVKSLESDETIGKLVGSMFFVITLLIIVIPYHNEVSAKEYEYITKVEKDYSHVVTINRYIKNAFSDNKISLMEGAKIITLVNDYHFKKNEQNKTSVLEQKKESLDKAIN